MKLGSVGGGVTGGVFVQKKLLASTEGSDQIHVFFIFNSAQGFEVPASSRTLHFREGNCSYRSIRQDYFSQPSPPSHHPSCNRSTPTNEKSDYKVHTP